MMLASLMTAVALSTAPQDYDTDFFEVREIRGEEGCAIKGDWTLPGRSAIYFQIDQMTNGEVIVAITSYGWSRPTDEEGRLMALGLRRSGAETDMFIVGALPLTDLPYGLVGMIAEGKADDFLEAFATNQSLSVLTADHTPEGEDPAFSVVLQAGLRGSADAVSSMRRCVVNVRRREDARRAREATVDHIARDPFARSNGD